MKTSRKVLVGGVVLLACSFVFLLLLFAGLGSSGSRISPASVQFVGFTNAASGVRLARFEIRNRASTDIARSGYCRVNGGIVNIMPTKRLLVGEAEIVEVPLTTTSGEPLSEPLRSVTFNGARSLTLGEEAGLAIKGILRSAGVRDSDGEGEPRNRWESRYELSGKE